MPRSGPVKKPPIPNDRVYKSRLVTRLINRVMAKGKKTTAEKVVYDALEKIKESKKTENPLTILEQAFGNIMPKQEVRSRRVGGANYQIPVSVKFDRSQALAIRWLLGAARAKKGKPMAQKLYEAIVEASTGQGLAVKKKEDAYRMAEANKAFAHFKW